MSIAQPWHAAGAAAAFISPFLGRKEQHGDAPDTLIRDVRTMLDRCGYQADIIAAAVRDSRQVADAHGVTAGLGSAVPGELIHSPVAMADWGESVVLGDHEA